MRFCQVDGTLLVEEAQDAYKTVIGNAPGADNDDFLQLPSDSGRFGNQSSQPANDFDLEFDRPTELISKPFDTSAYQSPPAAFDEPSAPKDFQYPQTPVSQSPFEQYQNPPGQPMTQQGWAPPPAPEANWQSQNIGANTPFQPPAVQSGQNQTLPIVSLVCGVLGLVTSCCYGGIPFGIAALITGFLGIQNINKDSLTFGGKGLAVAGMILGGVSFVLTIVLLVLGIALSAFGGR